MKLNTGINQISRTAFLTLQCHAMDAMSPDPITGSFVGEIRLGYEVENGEAQPIRGGSISGNLFSALAGACFSQETGFFGNYVGPRGARFPAVTVAGA